MTEVAPPEQPGWYQDAHGAWWWWDGRSWTGGAPAAPARTGETGLAVAAWILYLVAGGWLGPLVIYVACRDRPFVRHHAAEALNLTLALLGPQLLAAALLVPWYVDLVTAEAGASVPAPGPVAIVGIVVGVLMGVANIVLGIVGAVRAARGSWRRLPLPFHAVRGAVRPGEEPYSVA